MDAPTCENNRNEQAPAPARACLNTSKPMWAARMLVAGTTLVKHVPRGLVLSIQRFTD